MTERINNIGERIKKHRVNLGLTMEQLGKEIGTSKGTVNNWEKNRNLPDRDNAIKLANVFSITVDELLYGSVEEIVESIISKYCLENGVLVDSEALTETIRHYKFLNLDQIKDVGVIDIYSLNKMKAFKKFNLEELLIHLTKLKFELFDRDDLKLDKQKVLDFHDAIDVMIENIESNMTEDEINAFIDKIDKL